LRGRNSYFLDPNTIIFKPYINSPKPQIISDINNTSITSDFVFVIGSESIIARKIVIANAMI